MIDLDDLYADLFEKMQQTPKLKRWVEELEIQLHYKLKEKPHGDLARWLDAYKRLPDITAEQVNISTSKVGTSGALSADQQAQLNTALLDLSPWRKGPFELFGTHIDTEWRSDWKWDRVAPHISPLKHRSILDVGCGSGYHCWRMLGEGASEVIGIDPSFLFLIQFNAIKKYCGIGKPIHLLPIKMEDVQPELEYFDTTFSMGVLYHRKSPIDHLLELKGTLKKGGELVLETLVIDGQLGETLVPEDRYAMMRNVWFIPSIPTLELWLRRAGFFDIRCIESNTTSLEEQRATDWMKFNSLKDFIDPKDSGKTLEGYPAPMRATFVATKK